MLHFVVNKTAARRKAIVRGPVRCARWRLVMPCSCWSSLTFSSPARKHACLMYYIATVDSDKNLSPSPWSHTAETVLCFCSRERPYRRRPSRWAWQSRSRWCLVDLSFLLMWESWRWNFGWYQKHDRTWNFMDFSLTAESFFVVKSSMFLISSVELILLEHETSSSILSVCNFVMRPSTLRI